MNLILFGKEEIGQKISGQDPRTKHLRRTLKLKPGDQFEAGIINGKMGKAEIKVLQKTELIIEFFPEKPESDPYPVILIVGLTRPQIAKHIMRESASMGIEQIWFFPTDMGEKSYLDSNIWSKENYHNHLVKGAGQGFTTHIPEVKIFSSIQQIVTQLPPEYVKIGLDNIRPIQSLSQYQFSGNKVAIALGSERGLTDRERNLLENCGFTLLKIGERVLRTDTACIAGITLVLSKLGKI